MAGRGPASGFSVKGVTTRINGRHAFVYERLLELVARETEANGSLHAGKAELAQRFGCSDQTVTRSIARLRKAGLITCEPVYAENGAQLANRYRATEAGIEQATAFRRAAERERRERLQAQREADET